MHPNRNLGFYPNLRDENLNKPPGYDPDGYAKHLNPSAEFYNPQVYRPPPSNFYLSANEFVPNFYRSEEEFPKLSQPKLPNFQAEEFYPPGFSQSQVQPKTLKAPNPNAVSFVPLSVAPSPPPAVITPPQPAPDSEEIVYGVRGILSLQKDTTSDLHMLARGRDLTKLGLNMKSSETLSSVLPSVFQDGDLEATEQPEFSLPSCYYISKPILRMKMFGIFEIKTLFYIFYNMPGEMLQALSAEELYKRDWLYDPNAQKWYSGFGSSWKTFDAGSWEILQCNSPNTIFLSKDDVRVKRASA
ncbi:unnamed protein product [Blepharisma stoltei]|uniref:NOT2/NOT3/NOT5 C-terminal domain-containing protein n=1 Tax=Blepharisma stoltei TaxID=1481888 RepID=A0AAU9IYC2_9CILI|nr:unnamed protein product [Blepharisma stoltei]